jgi:hypothetical protein
VPGGGRPWAGCAASSIIQVTGTGTIRSLAKAGQETSCFSASWLGRIQAWGFGAIVEGGDKHRGCSEAWELPTGAGVLESAFGYVSWPDQKTSNERRTNVIILDALEEEA